MSSVRPIVGVVIPAYGHPRFLAEAIESAATQDIEADVKVVVVDDGCRFAETVQVARAFTIAHPGTVHYLRQANTRLPGARNTGIDFLLGRWPDLDSLFFLDADNHLAPHSLRRFRDALGDDPSVGWAYPDIGFFGFVSTKGGLDQRETAVTYSRLLHLHENISEAGSLVRGDMLRAGVRFDPALTSGFEDWDFWLRALDHGYRGVRAPNSGFAYRKRPESMLADSQREFARVRAQVRANHPRLFERNHILSLIHDEAPLYGVIRIQDGGVSGVDLFLDPAQPGESLTPEAWFARTALKKRRPGETAFPRRLMVMQETLWQALRAVPAAVRAVVQRALLGQGTVSWHAAAGRVSGPLLTIDRAAALDPTLLDGLEALPQRSLLHPLLPRPTGDGDPAALATALARSMPPADARMMVGHHHRSYGGPDFDTAVDNLLEEGCAIKRVPEFQPRLSRSKSAVFVVPARVLGDSDALALLDQHIQLLEAQKIKPSLLIELERADARPRVPDTLLARLEDVYAVTVADKRRSGIRYLGHELDLPLESPSLAASARVMERFQHVLVCGEAASLAMLGDARRWGAQTLAVMHPAFLKNGADSLVGRLLAFEHAISYVVGADEALRASLAASGLPQGKFRTLAQAVAPQTGRPGLVPAGWRPRDGFVFIVTYGRTGSTALQRVIGAIEGYDMKGESNGTLVPLLEAVERASEITAKVNIADAHHPEPWAGAEHIDPTGFAADLVDSFIRRVLKPDPEARRIGFKDIRYDEVAGDKLFDLLDTMRRTFSPVKIIFNTRPVEEVLKSSWWANMRAEKWRPRLTDLIERFEAYADAHPEACHIVRHEVYRDNPAALESLFAFLGEPFDLARVEDVLSERLKH